MAAEVLRRAALIGAAALAACGGSRQAAAPPAPVESVGAPDYFGRGIVRLGEQGDRVLIEINRPAYRAIVRFDVHGEVAAAAASERRNDPGMTWLAVPRGRDNAGRGTASVTNPSCAVTSAQARRECRAQPRLIQEGPPPLATGEVILLIVAADPISPAVLEDRLNLIPAGGAIARVPAFVMADRRDLWAAYLIRK